MAEQGWLGVLIEEENGGLGLGFGGAAILCEAMGRQLAASPFLSTSIMVPIALQGGRQMRPAAVGWSGSSPARRSSP